MAELQTMSMDSSPDVASSSSSETEEAQSPFDYSPPSQSDAPFPFKLLELLAFVEENDLTHIIDWLPHGRSFKIHAKDDFMPVARRFFKATKLRSFTRQLNLWGFRRTPDGVEHDAWHHECFIRGRPELVRNITRSKVKAARRASVGDAPAHRRVTVEDGQGEHGYGVLEGEFVRMFAPDEATSKPVLARRVSIASSAPAEFESAADPLQRLLDRRRRYGLDREGHLARRPAYGPEASPEDEHKYINPDEIDPLPFGSYSSEEEMEEAPYYDEFSSFIDQVGIRDPQARAA